MLDVGCGGGAAAFAVAARATHLTGVDRQQDMLDAFAAEAASRGIPHRTVLGRWPDGRGRSGQR
ncbi:methyltransferase domain-containing protein [Pseudonocardia nigra]|uniref:methyltransferase domain-containing protein n=1 Tax=Pseudonocardia nigra TaxID=1921578 RepID=UPI001C5F1625|nr:methyltransferase domain-containing protein [Pseudonocardia nigra]